MHPCSLGFPGGTNDKELVCQCRRHKSCRFDPWFGKIPWRRAWQPTPAFLPGESHGQRSLGAAVHGVAQSWTRLKPLGIQARLAPCSSASGLLVQSQTSWIVAAQSTPKVTCFLLLPPAVCPYLLSHIFLFSFCSHFSWFYSSFTLVKGTRMEFDTVHQKSKLDIDS